MEKYKNVQMLWTYGIFMFILKYICATAAEVGVGIIASNEGTQPTSPVTESNIPCNISVRWQYVDQSEIYYIYKAVRRFEVDPQIDLIVLMDYDPTVHSPAFLLDSGQTPIVKLYKGVLMATKRNLYHTALRYLNESDIELPNISTEPVCNLEKNESKLDLTGSLLSDTSSHVPAAILAKLVKIQKWTRVYVFIDNTTEWNSQSLLDKLSLSGVVFAVYNVDVTTDIHEILTNMYEDSVNVKPEIKFVLFCRFECLMNVFHAANEFDHLDRMTPSLLTLFSKWIAVVFDYDEFKAKVLEKLASELSNVAIVILPEFTTVSTESLQLRLKTTIADIAVHHTGEGVNKTDIVMDIKKGVLSLEPMNACIGYSVQTLWWTNHGREFHDVGYADIHGNIYLETQLFPNIKYGYSRRKFVITTIPYPPFVIKTTINGTTKYTGVCIDLLMELERVLNFTYVLVDPPDNKWGSVDSRVNDTFVFNGMIGQVQRQEVDIAAAPLAIIPEREAVVDFSYPIYHEYTTVVLKKPDPNASKWRTLVDPFKLNVLLFIGLALPVVTVLVCVLERYNPYYSKPEHAAALSLHHLHNAFWYMYGALLCQGGVHLPDSFAGRTIVSGWWIFCIIIVGTYCGNLIAFLTISKDITPFNTLEEMATMKDQYKWGTLGGTNWEVIFTKSNLPDFRKVGDAMIEFNRSDPSIFHLSTGFHIDRVKKGDYAWIGDKTTIELNMAKECDLMTIKEEFIPMKYGFAFQQNSPHTVIFSEQVMKSQEAGLFEIWRRKWWPKTNFCMTSSQPQSKPISLSDVQSAHYVCAIGVFVGSVAFLLELLIFRCRKGSSRRLDETFKADDDSQNEPSSKQRNASSQTE